MGNKPKVLIISDTVKWAYHEIALFIDENLSSEYDIYLDFVRYYTIKKTKNPLKRIKTISEFYNYRRVRRDNKYDVLIFLGFYFDNYFKEDNPNFKNKTWDVKHIIKGVYTDGFPPQGCSKEITTKKDFKNYHLKDISALVCGSGKIKDFYDEFIDSVHYANISNDLVLWKEKNVQQNYSKDFTIGWTGNPKREFKGYYSHVIPAINLAKNKYPEITLKSRFSGPIETLPEFYNDVDISVIASDADAGPFSFCESCLSNVPVISTPIGFPLEGIKDGVNGFIVEKDVQKIAEKIILLYENRELLNNMKKRVRNDYLNGIGNKEFRVQQWRKLFESVLKNETIVE